MIRRLLTLLFGRPVPMGRNAAMKRLLGLEQ